MSTSSREGFASPCRGSAIAVSLALSTCSSERYRTVYEPKALTVVGRSALGQVLGTAEARARNGAAGAVEAGVTALTIRDQIIHPTINQEVPDPECDLDYVPNVAREARIRYALSNSFGFGGTNACILLKRFEE